MAHPLRLRLRTSNCSLLLIYLPRKDERLSRPGWLTYSGRFTHTSGHPSAAGRAQHSESSPVRDRRSTTVPRNQSSQLLSSWRTSNDDAATAIASAASGLLAVAGAMHVYAEKRRQAASSKPWIVYQFVERIAHCSLNSKQS